MQILEHFRRQSPQEQRPIQPLDIITLDGLESPNTYGLKDSVRRNKGVVEILVHPFHTQGAQTSTPFEQREGYVSERDDFVQSVISKDIPLVVFQEEATLDALSSQINAESGRIYVVPTLEGEARPSSIKRHPQYHLIFMNYRIAAQENATAWKMAIVPLKNAGVKRAVVGGEYMVLVKPGSDAEEVLFSRFSSLAQGKKGAMKLVAAGVFPSGCPGQVINELLRRGIDISISPISSPTNRIQPTVFDSKPQQ